MAQGVALLAFSYDREDALPGVYEELKALESNFKALADVCTADVRWKVRQDDLESAFLIQHAAIRIFHFSGHAGPSILQLNQDEFTAKISFASGLAGFIGGLGKGLKLVFLNGCATKDQADAFLQRGVPAVIASTIPIKDTLAFNFASRFYRVFTNRQSNLGLAAAFDLALQSYRGAHGDILEPATGKLNEDQLDERVRGNFAPDDEEPAALYQLHLNPGHPDIKLETFADWMSAGDSGRKMTVVGPDKMVNMGKHEDGYLLCNRQGEATTFEQVCDRKRKGELAAPVFFFYHDLSADCPHLLPKRFNLFHLPKLGNYHYEDMPLPTPDQFGAGSIDDANNPQRDRFKIRLSELYREKFGGQPAEVNRLCVLNRRPPTEQLLIIHHALQPHQWTSPNDQLLKTERRARLRHLLTWYASEYADDLRANFSERLVVLFSARYLTAEDVLAPIPSDLAQLLPDRFYDVPDLADISVHDVDEWQESFLGSIDRTFIDPPTFFGKIDPAGAIALPLQKLISPLQAEIRRFNQG